MIISVFSGKRYIDLIFVLAYLCIDFIPLAGAIDIIGPQWFYTGVLNLVVLTYLWDDTSQERIASFQKGLRSPVSLFFILYCLIALLSILFAINRVESLVAYARLAITFVAFMNFLVLLKRTADLFPLLSQVAALLLCYSCIQAVKQFFTDIPEIGLDEAVVNIKAGTGNKNVFAASIIIRLPFVLYCICCGNYLQKAVNTCILTFIVYTVFLVNARAAFIALLATFLIYILFVVNQFILYKNTRRALLYAGYLLAPILIAWAWSQITFTAEREKAGLTDSFYGPVSERWNTINWYSESGTGNRIHLYTSSVNMIRKHPFTGIGPGNWKLASIPYEKLQNRDAVVNYHSHNDFLETTAETGIAGGVSYLLIFVTAGIICIGAFLKNRQKFSLVFVCAAMALAGYFIDACLNFPMERTTMQVHFAFWLAIFVGSEINSLKTKLIISVKLYKGAIIGSFLLMLASAYITYRTFQSLIMQSDTHAYFIDKNPRHRWNKTDDAFPTIPNITHTTLPVKALQAEYLLAEKKYDEALVLLNNCASANPYIGYVEYLKGFLFSEIRKTDSAFYYAQKAFALRPLNGAHYRLAVKTCIENKDTATLRTIFDLYHTYRNESGAWREYLSALSALHVSTTTLKAVADSAFTLFPEDTVILNYQKKIQAEVPDLKQ